MLTFDHTTGEWIGTTGGVNLQELNARKPKEVFKKEKKQKQTAEEIRAKIATHTVYGFADKLARKIISEYGYKCQDNAVIFRNQKTSYFQKRRSGNWQVVFSYRSLSDSYDNYFREYATVGHVWVLHNIQGYRVNGRKGSWKFQNGLRGVWMEVLHELAHFVDMIENNTCDKAHGQGFQTALSELITLYPYEEC